MRLTCPNCGAVYETPAGMIPKTGRHVQCSDCNTRWFVSGPAEMPDEEQTLRRLEERLPRLRAVPDPEPDPDSDAKAGPSDAPQEIAETFVWEGPVKPEAGDTPAPGDAAGADDAPIRETTEPISAEGDPPSPSASDRPVPVAAGVPQPRPVPRGPEPALPHGRPRLDLTSQSTTGQSKRVPRSRFRRGMLLVLTVFLMALLAYLYAGLLAAQLPSAAPVLGDYARFVDGLREGFAQRLPGER